MGRYEVPSYDPEDGENLTEASAPIRAATAGTVQSAGGAAPATREPRRPAGGQGPPSARTNTSVLPVVSFETRFEASEEKATVCPSLDRNARPETPESPFP
jgi:hypothetical protein